MSCLEQQSFTSGLPKKISCLEQQSLTSGLPKAGGNLRTWVRTIPSPRGPPGNQLFGPDRAGAKSRRGWGRSAHGFPGDRAEAAGSFAAVGRNGMEELGVGPEVQEHEADAAWAMEQAEAGTASESLGAPGPEEPGGPPWCK